MLTLNVVVQTQVMLNAQVAKIWQSSRKTPKNSTNSFWPNVNWSCMREQRSWKYQKAMYSPFCMNICQREGRVQSVCRVCSQSIKNNDTLMIQIVVCNCLNAAKWSFCVNMWQWMKHGSTSSLRSQIGSQLSGQQQVKAVLCWPCSYTYCVGLSPTQHSHSALSLGILRIWTL